MHHPEIEDEQAAAPKRGSTSYHIYGFNPLIVERKEFKPYVWRGLDNPKAKQLMLLIARTS